MDIGHKIISLAILSLLLIQARQLSVAGKVLANLLGLSLHRKSVVMLNDVLDITIVTVVVWDVNPQKQNKNKATEFEILIECSAY